MYGTWCKAQFIPEKLTVKMGNNGHQHQAGANRAPEGAVTTVDDAQSRASGYCSVIAPSVVVIRIHLHLHVGVGVECLSRNVDRGGGRTWR